MYRCSDLLVVAVNCGVFRFFQENAVSNIYQEIWDLDQAYAGIKAIKKGESTSAYEEHGYIVVNESGNSKDYKLLSALHIPESKEKSYFLARMLFNNYTLDQTKDEINKLFVKSCSSVVRHQH